MANLKIIVLEANGNKGPEQSPGLLVIYLHNLLGEEGKQHRRDEDTHGEEYPGREMGAEKVPHTEEPQVLKHVQPNESGYHAVDH